MLDLSGATGTVDLSGQTHAGINLDGARNLRLILGDVTTPAGDRVPYVGGQNLADVEIIGGRIGLPGWRGLTAAQITAGLHDGIRLTGQRVRVERTRVAGVFNGVKIAGADLEVSGVEVDGWFGNGVTPVGSRVNLHHMLLRNGLKLDAHHLDGMQTFDLSGTEHADWTIEDNVLDLPGERHPLASTAGDPGGQGIYFGKIAARGVTIRRNRVLVPDTRAACISLTGVNGGEVTDNVISAGGCIFFGSNALGMNSRSIVVGGNTDTTGADARIKDAINATTPRPAAPNPAALTAALAAALSERDAAIAERDQALTKINAARTALG